ncbi:hypothetical protein [Dorea formicigenerans]|uniref:hypothetical protein n=1 Tax=Dorea formicigenerans TaxID=39486 RepID=UPI001FA949A3|nr:hypothetical protein [Dorea formicigenerans]
MEIVSGRTGKPHVTSQQFRQLIEGTVGQESCILTSGENLEPELASNNSLKIRSGMLAHHGNISSVKIGTYDEVGLSNGSQGMKRIDLVVCRYTKNAETEVESCDWVVIMGTPAASNPVAPAYTVGNLQDGDLVDDCPIFEVHYDGINVTEVKKLVSVVSNLTELNSNIKILNSKKDSGHALKVFNASENLVYGCWDDGLYRYPGYYSGNGAPSDWAGIMLVSPIFVNGEINGFLKVAWDMSMTQYIMKNNKDGSVSQAWTKM